MGHTANRFRRIEGLTRLAANAVANMGVHRPFTATVVATVQREQPVDPSDLIGLCENQLAGSQPAYPGLKSATGEEFAKALVERGVLSSRADERYEVAIPSMAEWLAHLATR